MASWGVILKSKILLNTCTCPTGWYWPPITPNESTVLLSLFKAKPGIIVCNGLLPPSIQFGWSLSILKLVPLLWNRIPDLLDVIPLPNE